MINYLKGKVADVHKGSGFRVTLILEVNHVGYELQVLPRLNQSLQQGKQVQVFTHQQIREDQMVLYGFGTSTERDLFRQLVSVSGIGAQLAIALLDTLCDLLATKPLIRYKWPFQVMRTTSTCE